MPSESPSEQPSSMPSEQPSSMPSESPSEQPSSMPSEQPSSMPSESPSEQPSGMPSESPSEQPSSMPSESPSEQPSSMPSEQPSSMPSESPSEQPSSMPSEQPSSMPSSSPSELPSCTPSQAPTPSPSIYLFYPDYESSGYDQGCLNDGNQPSYMDANPTNYLFSTLDKCCSQHFTWNYESCMGTLDQTCARALWYPDWAGSNTGCLRDGNEPLYMTQNPTVYLYNTKADCCNEFYYYDYTTCMGSTSSSSGTSYYADWLGDDTCKNDGGAPPYMVQNPTLWLYDTLAECCAAHYAWKSNECLGTTTTPSGLYYPDWSGDNEGCLNDGNEPAYMTQYSTLWMHATLQSCCDEHYSWNLSLCLGSSGSSGSNKWYMDWNENKCVQDCTGASPCGGLAETWDKVYDTQDKCCENITSIAAASLINNATIILFIRFFFF